MIIVYDSNGQLCNRFWSWIDSIAKGILYNEKVIILQAVPEINYFDNLLDSSFISFPFRKGKSRVLPFLVTPVLLKLYSTRLFQLIGFVNGWESRCNTVNISRVDRDSLRHLFKPKESIVESVDSLFGLVKCKNTIIVGLHIRRGDYKTFVGGAFFYDDNVYASLMSQIVNLLPHKDVYFYIATNESIPSSLSDDFRVLTLKNGITAAHDLYALGKCDYIVGPPSTFSRWAAFINDVPLCFVWEKTKKIQNLDEFDRLTDYSHFEKNGEIPSITKMANEFSGYKPIRFYKRWLTKIM